MVLNLKMFMLLLGLTFIGGSAAYPGNSSLTAAVGQPRETLGECMGETGGGANEHQFDWKGIGGYIAGIVDAVTAEIPFPVFTVAWGFFINVFNAVSGNEAVSGKYFDDMEQCIGKMINSAIENDHVQYARSNYQDVLKNLDNFYSTMPLEGYALQEQNLQSLVDYMNSITDNTDSLMTHVTGDRPGYHHERFVTQALEAISMETLAWITFMQRMEMDLTGNPLACDKALYAMKRIEDRTIRFTNPTTSEFAIQYILDNSDFSIWEKFVQLVVDHDCKYENIIFCEGDGTYKYRDLYNDFTYYSCNTNECKEEQQGNNFVCVPSLPSGDCPFDEWTMADYLEPYRLIAGEKLVFRDNLRQAVTKTGEFVAIALEEAKRKHPAICNGLEAQSEEA